MLKSRREYEPPTGYPLYTDLVIIQIFPSDPLQSSDETSITLLKKVILFPYSPRRHLFNSSHITNSIGMMLCGMRDRSKFAPVLKGFRRLAQGG